MLTRVRIRGQVVAFVLGVLCLVGTVQGQEAHPHPHPAEGSVLRSGFDTAAPIPREKVLATQDIKNSLAKHNIRLIPQPPKPPAFLAKGTQFQEITPEKDFSYDAAASAAAGPPDWCLGPGEAHKYTSEKGSVMLNGHPLYLKGLNW